MYYLFSLSCSCHCLLFFNSSVLFCCLSNRRALRWAISPSLCTSSYNHTSTRSHRILSCPDRIHVHALTNSSFPLFSCAHLKEESYSSSCSQLILFSAWFQRFGLFSFGFSLLLRQIPGFHGQIQLLYRI